MAYGHSQLEAQVVYAGSDGDLTKRFYAELTKRGPLGQIAVCLFRAQKTSERAKKYRGGNAKGSFRRQAYDTKSWSIGELTKILAQRGESLGFVWGWKADPNVVFGQQPSWVIYCELPNVAKFSGAGFVSTAGQVSFHAPDRGTGPDFVGDWDGQRLSASRIITFCSEVLNLPGV